MKHYNLHDLFKACTTYEYYEFALYEDYELETLLTDEEYEKFKVNISSAEGIGLAYTTLNLNDEEGNTIEDEVAEMQVSLKREGKKYKLIYDILFYEDDKHYSKEECYNIDDIADIISHYSFDYYYSDIVKFADDLNLNLS